MQQGNLSVGLDMQQ